MLPSLSKFLVQTRRQLAKQGGSYYGQLTDMSWCMLATISLQELGVEAIFQEGRLSGWNSPKRHGAAGHSPFLFHCIRFHDPDNPTRTYITDLRGNEDMDSIAAAAAANYGWAWDESTPLDVRIKDLDDAAREAFSSQEFTQRVKAFLQGRSLEKATPLPDRENSPSRPRL